MILSDLVQKYQSFKDKNIWKINAMLAKYYNNLYRNINQNVKKIHGLRKTRKCSVYL